VRFERYILTCLVLAASVLAVVNWRKAAFFRAENERLKAELDRSIEQMAGATNSAVVLHSEINHLRRQTSELMSLRNEVTQLRSVSNRNETLATQLQQLRAENQQLRSAPSPVSNRNSVDAAQGIAGQNHFARDSWNFAGYASPEDALVSAIWAMKAGDPKTYLDSLAPEEQARVLDSWKDKSEDEIAQKHQSDVSQISGIRILDRQVLSPGQIQMNVYIEGPNRVQSIIMNQTGSEWKFGGFSPAAQAPTAATPAAPTPTF
jgi:hypothetical protein